MNRDILNAERAHLATLIEAVQRCIFFLDASDQKMLWPLSEDFIKQHQRDVALFESLAAINERFSKLQDTLGSGMRHAALLSGETVDSFLKVLSFYEKCGVIDSIESWQLYRTARNMAAHEYTTNYTTIAEHFNTLHELLPLIFNDAKKFVNYCKTTLTIEPEASDFEQDFIAITKKSRL